MRRRQAGAMRACDDMWRRVEADANDDVALCTVLRAIQDPLGAQACARLAAVTASAASAASAASEASAPPLNAGIRLLHAVLLNDYRTLIELARTGFAPAIIEYAARAMHPINLLDVSTSRAPWWLAPLVHVALESTSRAWRAGARECVRMVARVPFVIDLDRALLRDVLRVGVRDNDVAAMCVLAVEDACATGDFEPAIAELLRLWHERTSTRALVELCVLGYRLDNGGAIALYGSSVVDRRPVPMTRAAFVALRRRGSELVAHAHVLARASNCLADFDAASDDDVACGRHTGPICESVINIIGAEDEPVALRRRPFLIRAAYASTKHFDEIVLSWVRSGLARSRGEAYRLLAMAGAYAPALNHVLQLALPAPEALGVASCIRLAMDPSTPEYSAAVVLTLMHAPRSYADASALERDAHHVLRTCMAHRANLLAIAKLFGRVLKLYDAPDASIRRVLRMTGDVVEFVPSVRTRARARLEHAAVEYVHEACVICFETDAPESVALMPCKHRCVCLACALELDDCPLCRSSIETMRIWGRAVVAPSPYR